jgi:hypothetical protein
VLHLKGLCRSKNVQCRLLRGADEYRQGLNQLQLYPEATVPEEYGIVKKNQLRVSRVCRFAPAGPQKGSRLLRGRSGRAISLISRRSVSDQR